MGWIAVLDEAVGAAGAWGATPEEAVANLSATSGWGGAPLECRPHAGRLLVASGRLLVGRVVPGRDSAGVERDEPAGGS